VKIVVSLASMGSRLLQLEQALRSLAAQSLQPDAILLHVSEEPYLADPGVSPQILRQNVPALSEFDDLIQVQFVANTGSYRKIIPALQSVQSPDSVIVTADDDILYPPFWLERLVENLDEANTVTAYRCRKFSWLGKHLLPYENWLFLHSPADNLFASIASHMVLPTSGGGIAYRRSQFSNDDPLDELMRLAPMQDDIALRFLMLAKDVRVRWVPANRHAFHDTAPTQANSNATLYQHNRRLSLLGFTANDRAIRDVARFLLPRAPTPEVQVLLEQAARGLPFYKALYQSARRVYWDMARKQ
jgi:hypothetical protein